MLGFVELIDLGSQDEIALRQAVDFVRPGRDLDFSPGKRDVWVVSLLLCKLTHAIHKPEVSTKVGKLEGLRRALGFVNRVGELAEEQGHHPDISLAWGKVEITTWTHKINGLTESDFILAAKIDQLYKS